MKISDQGLRILLDREASCNRAYQDSRGIWTIGCGHTGPDVHEGLVWTDEQVMAAFRRDIERFERAVEAAVTVALQQHQFDALVSFCFNVGIGAFQSSTLVRKLNAGDFAGAAAQFDVWHIPPEITSRRNGEREQFKGAAFVPRYYGTRSFRPEAFPPSAAPAESFRIMVDRELPSLERGDAPPASDPLQSLREAAKVAPAGQVGAGESVDVSAFGPRATKRGCDVLIQVYFHRADQAEAAAQLAKESDEAATRRDTATLLVEVEIGQRIDVELTVAGGSVDAPRQQIVWQGKPQAAKFWLEVPASSEADSLRIRAVIAVAGAPAGSLRFAIPIVTELPKDADAVAILGDKARRYSYAFLSYASPDRPAVLNQAQALKAVKVKFFNDLLSLEPGDEWATRLYAEIDRCDVFLLFWSSHAARSKWVIKEADYALARHGREDDAPDFVPVILEGPPVPPRPERWSHIHFNDPLRDIITAETAARKPADPQSPR
jgi:GH24 family phage-related lysozyme (muramidase)